MIAHGLYLRPDRLTDALAALAARKMTIVAGATDHFPLRVTGRRDEDLLDITALPDLRRIGRGENHWWIPCQATWTDLIEADLPPMFDALKHAAHQVGGVQIQNVATLAGNVCNASPAADGVPCLLALDGEIMLANSRGQRAMPIADFITGPRQTGRLQDELVLGIRIRHRPAARSVFLKLGARRYLVISIAMVAAVADLDARGRVTTIGIAIGACSPHAIRLTALENALIGQLPTREHVRPEHLSCLTPIDDIRGTAQYRREAAVELVRRAIEGLAA